MESPIDYMHVEVLVFKAYGFFDIDTESDGLRAGFKVYCILFQIFYIYMGCAMQAMSAVNATSMKETAETFFINIAYINAASKFFIVYYKREQLQQLWHTLNAIEFRTIAYEENAHLQRALYFVHKLVRYNTIFGAVNLSVLIVMPVLRNVHEIPFPMWTPYDVNKSLPFFCFMYAFQLGNAIFAGGANLAVNMFVYLTLVMMEYALNLLGARFMRLGTAIDQSANYKDIVNCVKLHWQIENLAREVHKLFNTLLYIQVIQSAFLFANSGFLLITVGLDIGELAVPLFWLSAFLAEMSIYCYFGNNIIYGFKALSTKAYFCNFIAFKRQTAKAFLQVLHVLTARDMSIRADGLFRFELSLETFLKILKTTYSILMLINSMQ